MIKKITIDKRAEWWRMIIDYGDGQFGCNRRSLTEIMEELKYRVQSYTEKVKE